MGDALLVESPDAAFIHIRQPTTKDEKTRVCLVYYGDNRKDFLVGIRGARMVFGPKGDVQVLGANGADLLRACEFATVDALHSRIGDLFPVAKHIAKDALLKLVKWTDASCIMATWDKECEYMSRDRVTMDREWVLNQSSDTMYNVVLRLKYLVVERERLSVRYTIRLVRVHKLALDMGTCMVDDDDDDEVDIDSDDHNHEVDIDTDNADIEKATTMF